ncbi:MAG: hypothetical protein F8N39_05835 [Clostridiaceae bacterium]|nr:hypothetical protein [Clostridiaceae bacterium]
MEIYVVDLLGDIGQASYQPRKFAGTNVGPVGVEGLSTDLQGKPKPKLRGTAVNFSPPCVNTSLLIYQIDDGTAKLPLTLSGGSGPTALGVFDKRSPLTSGGSASLASIMAQSTTVAAGSFITYAGPEGWFLRVGSTPSRLTVTASEGALADRTVAEIVSRELMGVGGVCQGDILGVAEMDAKNPAEVGIWVGDEITLQPVLDSLLDSVNGFLTDTRDGRLQLGILEDPAGMQPVFTVYPWMIKSPDGIKITPTSDPGVGILVSAAVSGGQDRYLSSQDATVGLPCKLVKLLFDRNFTVLAGADLAGNAAADTSYVGLEYRTFATPADPSVMAKHASAPEFTCTTLLRNGADASKEAFRQARLRSVPRYVVEIPIDPKEAFAVGQSVHSVDLARGVLVKIPRFGWDLGKTFFCLGLIENTDATNASSTLLLWG